MHLNPGFSIKHVALASSFTSWCLSFPICKLQTICFSYAIGLLQGLNKSVYIKRSGGSRGESKGFTSVCLSCHSEKSSLKTGFSLKIVKLRPGR